MVDFVLASTNFRPFVFFSLHFFPKIYFYLGSIKLTDNFSNTLVKLKFDKFWKRGKVSKDLIEFKKIDSESINLM